MTNHYEASGGDQLTELLLEIARTMGSEATKATAVAATEAQARAVGSDFEGLRSGMYIDPAPVRDAMNARLGEAFGLWRDNGLKPERAGIANAMANSVGELPGVEVLEGANFATNDANRCGNYVLGERLGEDWASPGKETDETLWTDTTAFLRTKGYVLVAEPAAGDMIVYSSEEPGPDGPTWTDHFAILEEDGRATSRLGLGPLVRHDIGAVPSIYGDQVYFFRKEAPIA
jgi:hypothetical protein